MFSENAFFQVSRCECPHCNADDVKLKRLHRKKRIVLSLLYYSHVKLNYTVFTYMPRRRMFRQMERKISSQHKPRRFACLGLELKDSTIWMKWLIVVAKITKLISMLAMRLAIWASKYASRTLSSTILNLKVFTFKDWTRVHTMVDFKNIRFQSFTRIHQTCQIQKNPFWRAISKICGFGVRIHWFRVDGSPIRIKTYAVSRIFGFAWTGL